MSSLFFDSLEEAGLLSIETEDNVKYLMFDELAAFEQLTNWHYDLEVNLAGLEVISHLLNKLEQLRQEYAGLR